MKALILAAGLGTRLLPYTNHTPKPLFTINNQSLLDRIMCKLIDEGCGEIIINTHHLNKEIENFISKKTYPIKVKLSYEPEILGTGGAIKNVSDFWDDYPFIVINSDIVTDINISEVYSFHKKHGCLATLVLYDDKTFNTVSVNSDGFVVGFDKNDVNPLKLTFTGIQVLNPKIIDLIPPNVFYSSIDLYKKLIPLKIKAKIIKNSFWKDIGTPDRYLEVCIDEMAKKAFEKAFNLKKIEKIITFELAGDGSDRKWYRLKSREFSIIMASHGIKKEKTINEADSFALIGNHLLSKNIAVSEIILSDTFSGLFFLKDLGDINLQSVVVKTNNREDILKLYKEVIDRLISLSLSGIQGFDINWTYQTQNYDKNLILEKEHKYFTNAFLNNYLNKKVLFDDILDEFNIIADLSLTFALSGFMHRDFQSRNIMITDKGPYFIDYQGGRIGPIQYDLASLLIDPYVNLSFEIQEELLEYAITKISERIKINPLEFRLSFNYLSINRNLQILGAFAYLSQIKGKKYFEKYIPYAIKTLQHNLINLNNFPKLLTIVSTL
ncbi:MAG: phosphotransferase [Desulfobacterales bacterium]|nr:phosphotransferase [Desulfobacterales bacterium]